MFSKRGFTLIELMVVIAVMSILATVIFVASLDSGEKSRDAKRQADLKALQSAVELYKSKYGYYPSGCNGTTTNSTINQNNWSGHSGTCASGSPYIVNLAPEFIPVLPVDPKLNGNNSGYRYTTNADGTAYKIMALDTVESEVVSFDHDLFRCGTSPAAVNTYGGHACNAVPNTYTGNQTYNNTTAAPTPAQCTNAATYNNDYAVFGGYSDGYYINPTYRSSVRAREFFTDIIHCK